MKLLPLFMAAGAFAQLSLDIDIVRGESFETAKRDTQSFDRLYKRDDTVDLTLYNKEVYYSVDLQLAGQSFKVLLDTGSSDLWVYGANNPYCRANNGHSNRERLVDASPKNLWNLGTPSVDKRDRSDARDVDPAEATIDCESSGVFQDNGDNFKDNGKPFFIQYGDYSFALGRWGSSRLEVSGASLVDFTFGLANLTNSSAPVFGIGYVGNEASHGQFMQQYGGTFEYDNFPLALKNQGIIQRNLYSLYLNSGNANGKILFGAIDHAKHQGDLVTLPLVNVYADYGFAKPITVDVEIQSLGITINGEESSIFDGTISAGLLDSGTTVNYLPLRAVQSLADKLNAEWDDTIGWYVTDCPVESTDITLDFHFQGVAIQVPLNDMLGAVDSTQVRCAVLVRPSSRVILGDTFLRHAYVVYDLDGYQVQLAPVKITDSQQVEVISDEYSAKKFGKRADSNSTGLSLSSSSANDASSNALDSATRLLTSMSVFLLALF
ncbi:unnamed protein product [Cyberlindnera jadinii]|uniref:Peptidase A1 domain-containing protein n=1 Tax=Cyberlindnera jadinii (strain ATCC 18201 / CBS 1600 / BCRC 20928 / JCM 3617 / NBRC 0987 / NRRL Y-1542) TaxID=983966 RepID=A0A0H5BYI4_CYBJN|nr:unnamed protein product [Cyberlindnera jadinii]